MLMAIVLTDAQLDLMAQAAAWKFDVDFYDGRDTVVYTGDGVEDLTKLIQDVEAATAVAAKAPKLLCDVGSLFSDYRIVTVDDVYALRQRYIETWGTVNKPAYWIPPRGDGDAVQL